jgi:hypothetical protein
VSPVYLPPWIKAAMCGLTGRRGTSQSSHVPSFSMPMVLVPMCFAGSAIHVYEELSPKHTDGHPKSTR